MRNFWKTVDPSIKEFLYVLMLFAGVSFLVGPVLTGALSLAFNLALLLGGCAAILHAGKQNDARALNANRRNWR